MTEKELYNEYQKSDCKSFTDFLINKITDLEKENAELKEQHKSVCENLINTHRNIRGQLTKAKELLKQWLQTSKASSCDNINIVTNTEQLLKDN